MDKVDVLAKQFPGVPGISSKNNIITEWPDSLGPMPDDAQIAIWAVGFEEIEVEEQLISAKIHQVAEDRARKEAVRLLKLESKTLKHFNNDGKRI